MLLVLEGQWQRWWGARALQDWQRGRGEWHIFGEGVGRFGGAQLCFVFIFACWDFGGRKLEGDGCKGGGLVS